MIRYYDYFRSSAAYRSGIAFNLKGLSCDFVPVHLRRDGGDQKQVAYRALNPQAPVPALEIGVLAPTRSPAIVEWPHETRPEPPLPPADRNFRVRVRAAFTDAHPSRQPDGEG